MANVEWMTSLPEDVRNISVINLAIPGSHNSMTYSITSQSVIGPDANNSTRRLYYIVPSFVRRWAKTQSESTLEQLELGVRFFDLRICQKDEKFYYVHGLITIMDLFEPLDQIKQFCHKHPGEVVILDFQHNYGLKVTHHMHLHGQLVEFFGNMLYTPRESTLAECTLNKCTELGKQIILIYRRSPIQLPREFWPSHAWPTPWPNVTSSKKLQEFLDDSLLSRKTPQGFVSQCILTPTARYIALRFFSSLRKTAKKVDKTLNPWILSKSPGPFSDKDPPTVNVFLADFVNLKDGQFCNWVIELNSKLFTKSIQEENEDAVYRL